MHRIAAALILGIVALGARAEAELAGGDELGGLAVAHTRPLPFDPMTLEVPPAPWREVGDRRWWAAAAAQAVVGFGLIEAKRAAGFANTTEALMRRPEIHWDMAIGRPQQRLRIQFIAVRGRPRLVAGVVW